MKLNSVPTLDNAAEVLNLIESILIELAYKTDCSDFVFTRWNVEYLRYLCDAASVAVFPRWHESELLRDCCKLLFVRLMRNYGPPVLSIRNLEDDIKHHFNQAVTRTLIKPDFERMNELAPSKVALRKSTKLGEIPLIPQGIPFQQLNDSLFEQFQSQVSRNHNFVIPIIEQPENQSYCCRQLLAEMLQQAGPLPPEYASHLRSARSLVMTVSNYRYMMSFPYDRDTHLVALIQDAAMDQWGIRVTGDLFVACVRELGSYGPVVLYINDMGVSFEGECDESPFQFETFLQFIEKVVAVISQMDGVHLVLTGWRAWMHNIDAWAIGRLDSHGLDIRRLHIERLTSIERVFDTCEIEIEGRMDTIAGHLARHGVTNVEPFKKGLIRAARKDRYQLFRLVSKMDASWFENGIVVIPSYLRYKFLSE